MSREELLRQYILEKYPTVKAFCQEAGIATSTMDSILHRGLGGARIETGIRICQTLNISLDALADGKISPRQSSRITVSDQNLIDGYRLLPHSDRETVDFLLDRAANLASKEKINAV